MRTNLGSAIGVLAAMVGGVDAACAADIAAQEPVMKAPVTKARPVILSDWAGFYLGVHGGGGWGDTTWENGPRTNAKLSGGLVGAHIGYNWQFGAVVVGAELDFDAADIKTTQAFADGFGDTQRTNELGSARGRLGYVMLPNLLAYGTVGAGWGHFKFGDHHAPGGNPPDFQATSQFGWVAGAGIEYKVLEHVILRAEYLHYDFDSAPLFQGAAHVREPVDAVRGGLSYKF